MAAAPPRPRKRLSPWPPARNLHGSASGIGRLVSAGRGGAFRRRDCLPSGVQIPEDRFSACGWRPSRKSVHRGRRDCVVAAGALTEEVSLLLVLGGRPGCDAAGSPAVGLRFATRGRSRSLISRAAQTGAVWQVADHKSAPVLRSCLRAGLPPLRPMAPASAVSKCDVGERPDGEKPAGAAKQAALRGPTD